MKGEKSPELLHLFFRGAVAARLLERSDLGTRESRIIEAAIETAQSDNPDIEVLRRADAIVTSLREHGAAASPPSVHSRRGPALFRETELGRLSGLEYHADADPLGNPDTLLGYFYRDYQLRAVYGPALLLLLLLAMGWYFGAEKGKVAEALGLNTAHFSQAQERCRAAGKRLPRNGKEVDAELFRLREGRERLGYWLTDGRVYYPLTDRTAEADEKVHLYLCLTPDREKE